LSADGPRHPGPRPTEFEFPFALGRRALAEMEAELDELEACVRSHDDAGAEVCAAAEGSSATAFEAWLSTALQRLVTARTQLADDIETLRTQLALAEQRRADRQQAIAIWERRMREHREHEVRS
jgi:hypothetical protein